MTNWLALNDYSTKHKISVSTLRRRIKSSKIKYKLEEGKYFIMDSHMPVKETVSPETLETSLDVITHTGYAEAATATTQLILDELKKAYLDSLQGKEDQIVHLKQQVSDLQTLVMLLEKENEKLKLRGG